MGAAEKAIKERQRQARAKPQAQEITADQKRAHRRQRLIVEVEQLAPKALAGLEAAGWPGGTLVTTYRPLRKRQTAGWPAGYFEFRHKESAATRKTSLYLLSNGKWFYGNPIQASGERPSSFVSILERFAGSTQRRESLLCNDLPAGVTNALEKYAALQPGP